MSHADMVGGGGSRGLAAVPCSLLFVIAAMGCPGSSSSTETDNATETGSTGPSTSSGPSTTTTDPSTTGLDMGTTGVPMTSSSSSDSGSSTDDGTTSRGSSSTDGTTGTTAETDTDTDTETDTDEPPSDCEAGCIVQVDCGDTWTDVGDCTTACEDNLIKAGGFSPFCEDAWRMLSACLGTLVCEEYLEWENPAVFPYPCSDADVSLDVECEGQ